MVKGFFARRRAVWSVGAAGVALALACGSGAGAAAAASPAPPAGETLSPRLETLGAEALQGGAMAADPGSAAAAAELALPATGPGSLQIDDGGRVAVSIHYSSGPIDADLAALEAAGDVRITASSSRFGRVSATVAPADLEAVAALPGVSSLQEAVAPMFGTAASDELAAAAAWAGADAGDGASAAAAIAAGSRAACRTVPANLAGPLHADAAAARFGVDGTGATVGIISDSFDHAPDALSRPADDIAAGLLPGPGNPCGRTTPVEVVHESDSRADSDEGRAMAQLVHSIAPGARLLFASAGDDEVTFAQAIDDLRSAGATVIVDDVWMFTDPYFQDGPIGVAVRDSVEAGVPYLAAAGNHTVLGAEGHPGEGAPISSWETTEYRPAECPAAVAAGFEAAGITTGDCMDFDPGAGVDTTDGLFFDATGTASALFILQWAEPYSAARGDLRLALITPGGDVEVIAASPAGFPYSMSGSPMQAGESQLAIVRNTSRGGDTLVTPAVKLVTSAHPYLLGAEHHETTGDDRVGSSVVGHAGAEQTISVAAAPALTPRTVEDFSSMGPTTTYFDYQPDVSTVATPLPQPLVLSKPDVTGLDGGHTNFFSTKHPLGDGTFAFFGTSAAAPSAAAVLALGQELRPDLDAATLRAALLSSASPLDSPLPSLVAPENVAGAGLADVEAYLETLAAVPGPAPAPTPGAASVPASDQLAATGAAPWSAGLVAVLLAALLAAGGIRMTRGARPGSSR
ncbi:S8 family serine peptidase [Herbiconiux sp.]|uniref:S8 family serine peptidase n=1 Tax=Herbiconiux sp. TaxID=1871186 RepID=UPI0025B88133|nr:S8 family serine peptidase [Herbiconiux sp.]